MFYQVNQKWVIFGSIGKVSYFQIRNLEFNLHLYQKQIGILTCDKELSSWCKRYKFEIFKTEKRWSKY